MFNDQLLLNLFSVVAAIFLIASVVCIPLCIFLKQRARAICIDVLLVAATLLLVDLFGLGMTSTGVKVANASQDSAGKAEMSAYTMRLSALRPDVEKYCPWILSSPLSDLVPTRSVALQQTERKLRAMLEKTPNDRQVLGRLAIVLHESFGNDRRVVVSSGDPWLGLLGQELPGSRIDSAAEQIKIELPAGWYRNAALMWMYRTNGATAQGEALQKSIDKDSHERFVRLAAYATLLVFLCFPGLFVIAKHRRFATEPSSVSFPASVCSWHYKQVYACLLCMFYAQAVGSGLWLAVPKSIFPQAHVTTYGDLFLLCVGLIGVVLTTYFFLFRPSGTTFVDGAGLRKHATIKALFFGPILAFLAAASICQWSRLLIILAALAGKSPPHAPNQIMDHVIQAVSSGDAWIVFISVIAVVIIGPFCEEIIFRAVIYSRLRCNLSIAKAAALNGVIFATVHLDLVNFFPLMATGFMLSILYERYKSVVACTVTHGIYNSWVLLNVYLLFN